MPLAAISSMSARAASTPFFGFSAGKAVILSGFFRCSSARYSMGILKSKSGARSSPMKTARSTPASASILSFASSDWFIILNMSM